MPPRHRSRLILHAGMHKTGSTSLQAALAQADMDGVHPMRLGRPNHSEPCIILFADTPETHFSFRHRGLSREDLAEKRQELNKRLRRQLRNRPEETFVLSAEWFSTASEAALIRVRDRFAPHFEKIEVFAYIRPPAGFLGSSLQQGIKTGHKGFPLTWPNYRDRFERLDRVFGRDRVALRAFVPSELVGQDIIPDFASWTGIPLAAQDLDRRNTSMSAAALALISCYRRNGDYRLASPEEAKRDRQIVNALMGIKGPKFEISPERLEQESQAHAEDLAWIEDRLGSSLSAPAPELKDDRYRISDLADLQRAAAHFAPMLGGKEPTNAPGDPNAADAQAWERLSTYIAALP